MDELELDFWFVAAATRRTIHQYQLALDAVVLRSDGISASSLLARLNAELAHYQAQIDRREHKLAAADQHALRTLTAALRVRGTELAQMAAPVAWCQSELTPEPSSAQLDFAQEAASALVKLPCEIIAVPNADIGYATPVPIKHWQAPLPRGGLEPVVVFVPPLELRATTMLPLLVHEVGHTAVAANRLLTKVRDASGEEWSSAVEEAATATEAQTGTARAAALVQCDDTLQRWVVELLCDALATAYCGPAYLFAFAGAVLPHSIDAPSWTHPPPSERLGAMLGLLRGIGCDPRHTYSSSPLAGWLTYVENASLKLNESTERLLRHCTQIRPRIHATALDHLAHENFTPPTPAPHVTELLERRIVVAADPDGKRPIERRLIIDAAWRLIFTSTTWGGASPEAILRSSDDIEYQEILDRSIDLSYLVERWNEVTPAT